MSWPFTDSPDYGTTADLQECPDISSEGSPIEMEGQTPRAVACGKVAVLRSRRDPTVIVAARLFCKRKVCPDCGPRRRRRLAVHYTDAIGSTPVSRRVIDRDAWPTMAKRLRRLGANFLRIPAPEDRYVVLATAGDGDPVTDLAETLASAFEQMPLADGRGRPDRARVSSSRCWSVQPGAQATGSGGDGESGYELLGFARRPLAQVVRIAKQNGWYGGEIGDRELAGDWAEAVLLRLPASDTLAWRRFRRWVGLHWPDRSRGGQARAA